MALALVLTRLQTRRSPPSRTRRSPTCRNVVCRFAPLGTSRPSSVRAVWEFAPLGSERRQVVHRFTTEYLSSISLTLSNGIASIFRPFPDVVVAMNNEL